MTLAAIIQWLLAPIDALRAHDVGFALSWHGRLMTLAWGVLIPVGIVIARYFKVTPKQDWPHQLDNKLWWHGHLFCQYTGGICMFAGLATIHFASTGAPGAWLHRAMGYVVIAFGLMQFLAGWLRGSKGGPSEPSLRGDHYDMTLRRIVFEKVHKTLGYFALGLSGLTILTGLWEANAARWMWLALTGWWIALFLFAIHQHLRGRHVSSYHAIWGPDTVHPGNRR